MGYSQTGAVLQKPTVGVVHLADVITLSVGGRVVAEIAVQTWGNDALEEGAGQQIASSIEIDVGAITCQFVVDVERCHTSGILNGCSTRDDDINAGSGLHLLDGGADILPHVDGRLVSGNILVGR